MSKNQEFLQREDPQKKTPEGDIENTNRSPKKPEDQADERIQNANTHLSEIAKQRLPVPDRAHDAQNPEDVPPSPIQMGIGDGLHKTIKGMWQRTNTDYRLAIDALRSPSSKMKDRFLTLQEAEVSAQRELDFYKEEIRPNIDPNIRGALLRKTFHEDIDTVDISVFDDMEKRSLWLERVVNSAQSKKMKYQNESLKELALLLDNPNFRDMTDVMKSLKETYPDLNIESAVMGDGVVKWKIIGNRMEAVSKNIEKISVLAKARQVKYSSEYLKNKNKDGVLKNIVRLYEEYETWESIVREYRRSYDRDDEREVKIATIANTRDVSRGMDGLIFRLLPPKARGNAMQKIKVTEDDVIRAEKRMEEMYDDIREKINDSDVKSAVGAIDQPKQKIKRTTIGEIVMSVHPGSGQYGKFELRSIDDYGVPSTVHFQENIDGIDKAIIKKIRGDPEHGISLDTIRKYWRDIHLEKFQNSYRLHNEYLQSLIPETKERLRPEEERYKKIDSAIATYWRYKINDYDSLPPNERIEKQKAIIASGEDLNEYHDFLVKNNVIFHANASNKTSNRESFMMMTKECELRRRQLATIETSRYFHSKYFEETVFNNAVPAISMPKHVKNNIVELQTIIKEKNNNKDVMILFPLEVNRPKSIGAPFSREKNDNPTYRWYIGHDATEVGYIEYNEKTFTLYTPDGTPIRQPRNGVDGFAESVLSLWNKSSFSRVNDDDLRETERQKWEQVGGFGI